MDLMVEASPRRVFANAHTYHINSISVNSDCETYLSADDLRVNLWHLEITDRSFSILLLFNCMLHHLLLITTLFMFCGGDNAGHYKDFHVFDYWAFKSLNSSLLLVVHL